MRASLGRLVLVVAVALLVGGSAGSVRAQPPPDFAALDRELRQMHEAALFSGGKAARDAGAGAPAAFAAAAARQRQFSAEGIALAEELVAFTNDLRATLSAGQPSIEGARADLAGYPRLAAYFAAASAQRTTLAAQAPAGPGTPPGTDQAPELTMAFWGYWICGWYSNPKPASAAAWRTWASADPAGTLWWWGYHQTEGAAGGGWTRPQTWNPWACGWGTFRDHAIIIDATAFREQSYAGWEPWGEPNPEVYGSGPWPYPDWPAYVWWWHQDGPGR